MMCGSSLSSTHAKIDGVYGKTGILNNHHELAQYLDNLDDVQIIHFLGGEPLLTDAMWTTLKEVKRRGLERQLDISIVTNGSLLHRNKDNLIDLLEGFHFVDIAVSIDCIGDQHNYWRQKNTWAQVEANCKILYEWKQGKDNVHCAIRTAICWPNAYAARDVFDRFKDMDVEMRWNLVTNPIGLSLPMLPQEDLEKLVEHWKDYPDVQQAFKKIKSNPNSVELMRGKRNILRFDDWHKNSFLETFPEHSHMWNNIG
jgi:sulfatase maturation enzyme AslB (radical SAM superfamily)